MEGAAVNLEANHSYEEMLRMATESNWMPTFGLRKTVSEVFMLEDRRRVAMTVQPTDKGAEDKRRLLANFNALKWSLEAAFPKAFPLGKELWWAVDRYDEPHAITFTLYAGYKQKCCKECLKLALAEQANCTHVTFSRIYTTPPEFAIREIGGAVIIKQEK
jgi:hypothetical protein